MFITELKTDARELIKKNAPKIFIISVIFVSLTSLLTQFQFLMLNLESAFDQFYQYLSAGIPPGLDLLFSGIDPTGAALAVALWLILPIIEVGYLNYCMRINRKLNVDYKDILDGFLVFAKIILIRLITSSLVALGIIFFIFPGLVLHYMFRQSYYILLDASEKNVFRCIRESMTLMSGKKLDLFLIDLSFIGWDILSYIIYYSIPAPFFFPIVSVWLTPYKGIVRAAYYDKLIGNLMV